MLFVKVGHNFSQLNFKLPANLTTVPLILPRKNFRTKLETTVPIIYHCLTAEELQQKITELF